MAVNLTLYLSVEKPDVGSVISGAKSDKKLFSAATFYDIHLEGAVVRLNVYPKEKLSEHLRGFLGYVNTLNGGPDRKADISDLIQGTRCVLGVVTDKELSEVPTIWRTALQLAQAFKGFLFHQGSVLHSDGTPLIGPAYDALAFLRGAETSATREGTERRERSLDKLKKLGIPFIADLPVLPAAASLEPRSAKEVAQRALAVFFVCAKSDGLNLEELETIRKKYKPDAFLTPKERSFIQNPAPDQHEVVQKSWQYECLWVLCWALHYVPDLGEPFGMCNVRELLEPILKRDAEQFLADARLRDLQEILEANDLVYRYHWATRDAHLKSQPTPGNLNGGVVQEWHLALNWLTRYFDADWDDVTTDT